MSLLNLSQIPYNTRERTRRRAVSALLLGNSTGRTSSRQRGALVHIEDSPFDLARKIIDLDPARKVGPFEFDLWRGVIDLDPAKKVGPAFSEAAGIPDWEVDQRDAAQQMLDTAGADAPRLVDRAHAVVAHLCDVEASLPFAPRINWRMWMDIMTRGVRDHQEIAWWQRTARSSVVGTKLSLIDGDAAMNLVLHGYYLAMANLHLALEWPLLRDLDTTRLKRIFGGIEFSMPTRIDHTALHVARRRSLNSKYSAVVFLPIWVHVREAGKFIRRMVVVAVAIDDDGRHERIGEWIAPSSHVPPADQSDEDPWLDRKERIAAFWKELLQDLMSRGTKDVGVLAHDVPGLGMLGGFRAPEERHGFLEAAAESFPSATVVPRPSGFCDDVISVLMLPLNISAMKDDISGLFKAPDAGEAQRMLDRIGTRWGEQYPKLSEALNRGWDRMALV